MKALILESSKNEYVSMEYLDTISLPRSTDTYTPVPHTEVITTLLNESSSMGLEVLDSRYALRKQGKQLFISITLAGSRSKAYEWSLVGINSYDKTLALRLGGGLNTKVCTNQSLSGDYCYYHKHTKGVSLKDGATVVLSQLPSACEALEITLDAMKVPITKAQGAYFLLIWGESIPLSNKNIYRALELWEAPMYPEFTPYGNQVYGLYQAVTYLCKEWPDNRKYPLLQSLASTIEGWVWI